jgi:hypothetical protein
MLLVSTIMLVSSTYAWFTLSTAPEVSNITTTVAGNGSLEIALMPTNGLTSGITSGSAGGAAITTSNLSWGNLITLSDDSTDPYGLGQANLLPAAWSDTTMKLTTAVYGSDGRITTSEGATELRTWAPSTGTNGGSFGTATYGVRVFGESDGNTTNETFTTYGYVVDLAFRLNAQKVNADNSTTDGSLLLQTDGTDRIYDGNVENDDTMGGGSYMEFTNESQINAKNLLSAVRVTFVKNYGLSGGTAEVIGTAKLDLSDFTDEALNAKSIKAPLCMVTTEEYTETVEGVNVTKTKEVLDENGTLTTLAKNTATQISAIVWLDGSGLTNADMATAAQTLTGTLNLQFTTDVDLTPASNTALKTGESTTSSSSSNTTNTVETTTTPTE